MRPMKNIASVEEYLQDFPADVQEQLRLLRALILQTAPDAVESISYGMPAYKLNGVPFVYFGGYPKHIGLYATPNTHSAFAGELSAYKQGKGSVQFPLRQPLPLALIERMLRFRLETLDNPTQKN
jgi:uncharacterized protein YdhG (YjbR/CyaY superfamily)